MVALGTLREDSGGAQFAARDPRSRSGVEQWSVYG